MARLVDLWDDLEVESAYGDPDGVHLTLEDGEDLDSVLGKLAEVFGDEE